ncbi:MAG TPA: response regulator [Candidatus Paceibacterota bacterium]
MDTTFDIADKKVLILEDERPLSTAIEEKLKMTGLPSISARSVEEGLSYIENENIGLVWLDHYLLGKRNGLDFVAELNNVHRDKNIPVFVVSNTASPDKKDAYLAMGVEKFYTKADHRLDNIISDIKGVLDGERKRVEA